MVRLPFAALIFLSLPALAWSNPLATAAEPTDRPRSFHLPQPSLLYRFVADVPFGRTEVAPNALVGFGMFGLTSDKNHLRPVTGREIDARKQRRAAVGLSLKF